MTPPMMSSPPLPAVSTAVDVTGEDKENQAPRDIINLTGDSDSEEEVPDRAEDSGRLMLSRRIVYSIYYNSTLVLPDRVG